jgi:hypothetical protein
MWIFVRKSAACLQRLEPARRRDFSMKRIAERARPIRAGAVFDVKAGPELLRSGEIPFVFSKKCLRLGL